MKPKRDFLLALDTVRAVVVQLRPDQMTLPTPDTKWSVYDLLNHMMYELAWVPDMIMGETIADVGIRYDGDLLGANPIAAWRSAAVAASEAVRRCDPRSIAHLSYGDKTVHDYLQEAGADQIVHAWDLGEAIGVRVVFDEQIASQIYERMIGRQTELVESGLFAEPVPVNDLKDIQTKLLAQLGRRINWRDSTN